MLQRLPLLILAARIDTMDTLSQRKEIFSTVVQSFGPCVHRRPEPVGLGTGVNCFGGGLRAARDVGNSRNAEAGGGCRSSRRRADD